MLVANKMNGNRTNPYTQTGTTLRYVPAGEGHVEPVEKVKYYYFFGAKMD